VFEVGFSHCTGFDLLPKRCGASTTPPCHRGPRTQPSVQFKYNLRPSVRPYLSAQSIADGNLVSISQGRASTMSKSTTAGSGPDKEASLKDVVACLTAIEEIIRPLQLLTD
jgi:hypothetical protein